MVSKILGVQVLTDLRRNVGILKQTGKAAGSWVVENPGADVADTNLTLAELVIAPHTYHSSTAFTRELLLQSAIEIDSMVAADLAADVALALDAAVLTGAGSGSSQPTEILSTAGVGAYTLAGDSGNGATPSWADICGMQEIVEEANASTLGGFGWATTPGIKNKLKQTPRMAGGSTPVWADDDTLSGKPALVTNLSSRRR